MTAPVAGHVSTVAVLAALAAFAPASIAIYLPAIPTIAGQLGASPDAMQATLGTFFVGFALGMPVYGPLSDRFGRRPVLAAGILLYVAASLGCALAQDIGQLTASRLLQALGGGSALVIARAVARDLFETDQAARVMSLMAPVIALVPLLAPILGGWILEWAGWRAIFAVQALFGGSALAAYWFHLPETAPSGREAQGTAVLAGAMAAMLRRRDSLGLLLAGGSVYGGMIAYVSGAPFAYITYHGVAPSDFGYLFGCGVLGIAGGSLLNGWLVARYGHRRMLSVGLAAAAAAGGAVAVVGATGLGGLPLLVAALVSYVGCTGLVGGNVVAGHLGLFPGQAGTASAVFGTVQFALAAAATALVGHLHDGTPAAMSLTVGGAAAFAFLSFHILVRPCR